MTRIPKVVLLLAGVGALIVSCRQVVRPAPTPKAVQSLSVLCFGDIDWTELPEIATLVKTEKPALSVITGKLLSDGPVTYLFHGQAECAALAASGIDAIRLTPEFLSLGAKTARSLADSVIPPVFLLGGNVRDSSASSTFGSAYLRRTVAARTGTLRLGLIGLAGDGTSPFWNQTAIAWQNPDSAIQSLLPSLKLTSDLVGVVAPSGAVPGEFPGADFVITAGAPPAATAGASRLELKLDAQNRVVATRVLPITLRSKPDSAVLAIVNRYQRQADSLLRHKINEAKVELDTTTLTRIALRTAPSVARADGALFGNTLVLKPLGIGDITLARLFDVTGTGNRLVRTYIEGQEFGQGLTRGEPGVEWRSILRNQRVMLRRQYDIVTTLDYVQTHPLLAQRRHDFLPVSLAEVYAFSLRERGKAKPDTME
jgi:2',3'-cyclic-nucleotide 2'-phosphodiesterase (5'-nucleotidase family)